MFHSMFKHLSVLCGENTQNARGSPTATRHGQSEDTQESTVGTTMMCNYMVEMGEKEKHHV